MKIAIDSTVSNANSNARFDAFLALLLKDNGFTRKEAREMIESGVFSVNGIVIKKPSFRLAEGSRISGVASRLKESLLASDDAVDIEVLFEDDQLLAINKPTGMPVHPTAHTKNKTVANWIKARYPDICATEGDDLRPGIVHRLDRDTSGVLIIAKTPESYVELKKLFHDRQVAKVYEAIVIGHFSATSGVIDMPLARKKHSIKRSVVRDGIAISGKIRDAVTEYEVIRSIKDYDVVRVFPKTGRTHQIRAHFAALGHPIVGDALYQQKKQKKSGEKIFPSRQLLHAQAISFELFGQRYEICSPIAEDFSRFLSSLDE